MVDKIAKENMYLTSRVIVTLEYDHPSTWSTNSTAVEVMNAAAREAEIAIQNTLLTGRHSFRILHCEPKLVIGRHNK